MGATSNRRRYVFDTSTNQHVFRPQPAWIFWLGVALVPVSAGFAVIAFVGGPFDGQSLLLLVCAPIGAWLGIRCTRLRIIVTPTSITVLNYFHSTVSPAR